MKGALPVRPLLLSWLALLALLAATLALAYVPLGPLNLPVALAIGAAKTAVVVVVFMKLGRMPWIVRIAAGAGLFWLAILFALTFADYATRTISPT